MMVKGVFVIREWPNLFLVNCERTMLFFVKRDLYLRLFRHFTTLITWKRNFNFIDPSFSQSNTLPTIQYCKCLTYNNFTI